MAMWSSCDSVFGSWRTTSSRLSRAPILTKISTAFRGWPAVRYISPAARRSPSSSDEAACLRMRPCAMESSAGPFAARGLLPSLGAGARGSPAAADNFGPAFSPCCAQCFASSHLRSSVYISTAMLNCLARPKCAAASLYFPWNARTCAVTSCSSSWVRLWRPPYCCVIRLSRSMYLMSRMRMKALRAMSKRRVWSASSASSLQSASVTPKQATR
mmetsp:Transcript_1551/g.3960  ORF Transcript_1551/g.3960 Transcript_1551/m.3960 type:complete len:215 (+) Transcript_1551:1733-2377(+)